MTTEDKLSLMLLEKKDQFKKIYPNHPFITSEVIYWMIKAYNLAIEDAASSAEAEFEPLGWLAERHSEEPFKEGEDYEIPIIRNSILKLKLKL
jgi:hypothetical protein